jgi:hypothetical protein
MRLMSALASVMRNMRGFGLPGCGNGVTVPISTKPKPSDATPSRKAPSLSRPAARPTALGKRMPMTLRGVPLGFGFRRDRPSVAARFKECIVNSWAFSGCIEKSSGRTNA